MFCLVEHGAVVREDRADVVVPWWSFTKSLIAAAVMRLAEAGEIELDAPLAGGRVTPRALMRHEARVPDYGGVPAYHAAVARGDAPWPMQRLLAEIGPREVPAWSYSNIGYARLREMIEQRRGPEALDALVLKPLGLSARLARLPSDLSEVMMGSAAGYHPGWVYHGLVVGPLREAALAVDGLPALVGAEAWAEMTRPTALPQFNRPPWALAAYGGGLMTPRIADGRTVLGHTGGGPGSGIAAYGLDGRSVAVFALEGDGRDVEAEAVALLTA